MADELHLGFTPKTQFPKADKDGGGLSPRIQRAAIAFIENGSVPKVTKTLKEPSFVSQLIETGVIQISPEILIETGFVKLSENDEDIAERLYEILGEETIENAKRYLREQPGAGIRELVDNEVISREIIPELLLGIAAAEGGILLDMANDACTLEERTELRRLNSEAITDWSQHESDVIGDNFDNGANGLRMFVEFMNKAGQSVTAGITTSAAVGAEVVLWIFAVSVPLQAVILGLVISGLGKAITSNDKILEEGIERLEEIRAEARQELRNRVEELREEVTAAGNNCPKLRALLQKNRNLPRTNTTSALAVYLGLLTQWGRGAYGSDLTPPNPRRNPPEDRDKWVLYGGYTDWFFVWDAYDIVDEINRVRKELSGE